MEKLYEISMLLDFYGQLITKRQYEILDLYCNSDYSLGEISEMLKISRQGVYDNIKRGKEALYKIEENLKLVERFLLRKKKAAYVQELLDSIDSSALSGEDAQKLEEAKQVIGILTED